MTTLLFFAHRLRAMPLRTPLAPPAGGDMIGGGCAGEIFLLFWFFFIDIRLGIEYLRSEPKNDLYAMFKKT